MANHFSSHGQKISFELFAPTASGPHPAIVIAYGTRGTNAPFGAAIRTFASSLAGAGYVALIPNYFERTGTAASTDVAGDVKVMLEFMLHQDAWIETLNDALIEAARRPEVAPARIGLLGFSMGGHLALRTALSQPSTRIKAVVEFFAPVTQAPFSGLGASVAALPPVQIHHGKVDEIVPPKNSLDLEALLVQSGKAKGRDYELTLYPGQGHGFTGGAVTSSTSATIEFFDDHLG